MLSAHATLTAAALGDELTESEASLRVFLTAGGLAVLGLALLLFTIWWWRGTKPEPPALAPLEVMSDRRWYTASDQERLRMIDRNRPDGAFGLNGNPAPIPIDLSVLARDLPSGFDDLRDDPTLWPAEQPSLMQSSLAELLEGVGDTAVDDHSTNGDAQNGQVEHAEADVDAHSDADATMYQVEAPFVASSNGAAGAEHDEPSELVIDPLLQRSASQD